MPADPRGGVGRAELRRYRELELVTLSDGTDQAVLMRRVRRIRRLRRDLDLPLEAIAIIVRLLDRIEALERSAAGRPSS
jgi:hypothetical protein